MGDGDVTLLGPPFDGMAIARGARVLSRVNDHYLAFPGQGLVMRRSSYERARTDVMAWLTAMDHARAWALTSPDVATSFLVGAGMPDALAETMIGLIPNSFLPDKNGVALLIAQRRSVGLRGGSVTYSDLVDSDFLDSVDHPRDSNR